MSAGTAHHRFRRLALLVTAVACMAMIAVLMLLFSAAWSDLSFRGLDSVQAPDAFFTMYGSAFASIGLAVAAMAALRRRAHL